MKTPRLARSTLWRVFGRSLFIQAGFNTESLQTLGLVYALEPALKALYPSPEAEQAALQRHLGATFNTHPYVSAALVGGILFHEQRLANGEEGPESVTKFKSTLMGPLAALGDGFFWLSLRPAVGALAAALVPLLGAWAVLVSLVLYNVVHFTARWRLFTLGLSLGDGLVQRLEATRVKALGERLRELAAACAGGLGASIALAFGFQQKDFWGLELSVGCVAAGALAAFLAERRVSPYVMLYAVAALTVAASWATAW
jgi:PTS system mannose-specific IID component